MKHAPSPWTPCAVTIALVVDASSRTSPSQAPCALVLESLGLEPDPPRHAPARSPPELAFPP